MCRLSTAVKISAVHPPPPSGLGVEQQPELGEVDLALHPGLTIGDADRRARARCGTRTARTANRCSVRYGTRTPCRASSSSIFTTDSGSCLTPSSSPPPTHARICSSCPSSVSHAAPCPFGSDRADRLDHQPDQLVAHRLRAGLAGQARGLGRLDIPAGGLAVHPRPARDLPQPLTLEPDPQHLTHLDHADLPESHPR